MLKQVSFWLFASLLCWTASSAPVELPSWRESASKSNILRFVSAVIQPANAGFLRPEERIAVFDNDGTLWCEQPTYPQVVFGMDRAKALANIHPEWKEREPFRSASNGNLAGVMATGVPGFIELTAGTHAGITVSGFSDVVTNWLASTKHPRFSRTYTECIYEPMRELLTLLRMHGFSIYIVSGGSVEFLRPWTEATYGVPPERVIGSTAEKTLVQRNGEVALVWTGKVERVNDRDEKVLSIERVIGRRPTLAFGNSDGDLAMLEWTAAGAGSHLCGFVHHTDPQREYKYDRTASTGRLDKGLDEAGRRGWTVVDMQRDWKRVFPFEK